MSVTSVKVVSHVSGVSDLMLADLGVMMQAILVLWDPKVYCIQEPCFSLHGQMLYARYLCSHAHFAYAVARPSARDDRVSCIQGKVKSFHSRIIIFLEFINGNGKITPWRNRTSNLDEKFLILFGNP